MLHFPAHRKMLVSLVVLILSLAPSEVFAARADCPGANVVQSAAASFTAAARSGTPDAFAAAVARYVSINEIAMSALGQYRNDLQPGRRDEYLRNARAFVGRFLARYADRFANAELTISGCSGNLIRSSAGRSQILWRMSGNRIRDVRVGNIWLVLSMRSKFTSVIRRGKNIDALLSYLARQSS